MAFLRFGIIPNLLIALPCEFQSRLVLNEADGMVAFLPEFHNHVYLLSICTPDNKHECEVDYVLSGHNTF